jgi:hypothetical protein
VLSSQEERVWDEIQRNWDVEVQEPPRLTPGRGKRAPNGHDDVPMAVAVGARIVILLLLFGAVPAAVAVATATAVGWVLWRNRAEPSGSAEPVPSPTSGNDRVACGPAEQS